MISFVIRLLGVALLVLGYRIAFGDGLPATTGLGESSMPLGVLVLAVGGALLYSSFRTPPGNRSR